MTNDFIVSYIIGNARITSYNVCYRKLLREQSIHQPFICSILSFFQIVNTGKDFCVITSYSIHYTKLYENRQYRQGLLQSHLFPWYQCVRKNALRSEDVRSSSLPVLCIFRAGRRYQKQSIDRVP